jgi:RimJ/RimL family protein N-acetyltransferase
VTSSLQLRVVPYTERYLECSWRWLKDPELRTLTMTPEFSRSDQLAWFKTLAERQDYQVWGIELDQQPIGTFGFKKIELPRAEYFGYIGDKTLWAKGIGRWLMDNALVQARTLGITELYLKVSEDNPRAIHVYERHGFRNVANEDCVCIMVLRAS